MGTLGLQNYYKRHKGSKQCTENKQKREREKNTQKGGRQTTMQIFFTAHPQEARFFRFDKRNTDRWHGRDMGVDDEVSDSEVLVAEAFSDDDTSAS